MALTESTFHTGPFSMIGVHREANQRVVQCLIAALIVRPLDPALTDEELEDVVVTSGISVAVFKEIADESKHGRGHPDGKRMIGSSDLLLMLQLGDGHYPVDFFPKAPISALRSAFGELDREYGTKHPKALAVLISKCRSERPEAVELALGMAVALGFVTKADGGYVLDGDLDDLIIPSHHAETHPWVPRIKELIPLVEAVLAKRSGTVVPSLSPVDRFHRFLVKQSWSEFAAWWSLTSREMESASRYHPTAATVLAGALLEGALVAIAEPAKTDGAWRQSFLNDPPDSWKLGRLIDQAKAAGTFSAADTALAQNLAELRNRIHAGRYSTSGKGPFRPPSTNAHEAELSRLNLHRILDVVLGWPPVLNRS